MLAIFIGDLCFLVGFVVLMLPLVATELSRPRDGVWGALILFLGLVLLIDGDRLRGSPMMAVLLGSLLIFRLGSEVAQGRWQQLTEDEKKGFGSFKRWGASFSQLGSSMMKLQSMSQEAIKVFSERTSKKVPRKKWVRPEPVNAKDEDEQQPPSNNNSGQSFENSEKSRGDSS